MALELGLKLTRTREPDNATAVSELRISKNTSGPVFVSTETHASFILTCYLKGYDRNSFQIKISEDGKEISIGGEKPIQEMLMMGRVMLKKNVQIVGFRKVFKIPNGVVLDGIKAKFDEDESLLKIVMPKLVKGICGVQIEELKNEGFGESSSQKASETGENESVCNKEEGLSDKKLVESTNGDVTADTIQKEIESPRFEAMKKSELGENADHIPKNIGGESPENIMLGRPPGTTREHKFEGTPKEEIGEFKSENGGKDEERVPTEMSKEGLEANETSKEGGESQKVFDGKIAEIEEGEFGTEDRGEQRVKYTLEETQKEETQETQFECQGKDEEREPEKVLAGAFGINDEDIIQGKQKKEIEVIKFEREGNDKERVGTEISKRGLEAIDTTKEERESEKVFAGAIRVDEKGRIDKNKQRDVEEAKLETEGKDEKKVGTENNKEGLEAIESKIEGGESKKVLVGKIGVSEEDIVEGTEQRETDETKFEIEDRYKEKVEEVFKGTQEKEIKEEFDGEDTTVEGGVSELLSGATEVSVKDIVEGTKKGEIDVPKFENESRDEEMLKEQISNEESEARKTKIKESPMQELKSPIQLEESEGTFEEKERGEDKSEGQKLKEIEEPEFQSFQENSKIPKCATSKGENLEEIEEATEAMAKRKSQETEGILEKVEGEEPTMSKEASKVNGNDYARDSGKKQIEESAIRSSRDGQHMQDNNVSEVFEELGTDTAKFPKQTKVQKEREVKVKEEIIVKREREVKVKEVMIVNKYDEAKEGFEKATTGDRIQLETGQPRDRKGFDEEKLEAAKWDKTKALKEGSVETEPSLEKVKGESNDNLQGAFFSPFMKDNKRERTERTQKETEDPKVGTKHEAQHRVQELPTKIAESMDEREGPKDTKTEEMKEAKRKSEETQVVADEESTIEEKIQEAEIEKALQEVPEAKDREALGKGMRERESMLSTQQSEIKEIDKVCEECKRSEANLEREKWRTTQSVEDEKLRRENAVKHVAESMQKAPEKEHPGKSEVEKEAKVAYPELRKEVETKNEVEGSRLKESPPPKVKVQSLEPLESGKKNMKWKSPKTKKLVPEAREGEEHEAGKAPEVKSLSSTQQSVVDEEKSEIDFPKSNTSRTPSEEKEIEALQPNVLSDKNLEGKEHFKTLTEDRGHYLLEKEKRLETRKVAEEEKLNQKDEEETLSCKRERTRTAECKDKKCKMKRNGSEKINQIKGVAEGCKDVLAENETEKSQEILLPQTAEIQGKEKISEIREVQQEKRMEIPFHANEESQAVISNRETESQKPNAAHPKESSIKFSSDKPKGEVDKLHRKNLLSPSVEELSKGSSKTSRPAVKEDAPTVENFPQFQERKESTSSVEGTEASETAANELDKPPAEKSEVAGEGKIDECRDDGHLEFQEPEKEESELDFQESTRRKSDQEVEKTQFSQQEENHEGHAIEEEKAGEAENVAQVEISQESEDLEDIKVEASEKKVELCAPLVFAGSVFIASLIIFFFGHKGARKR